jgi:hypothetical protein
MTIKIFYVLFVFVGNGTSMPYENLTEEDCHAMGKLAVAELGELASYKCEPYRMVKG